MVAPQPIEPQQRSHEVFETKHYVKSHYRSRLWQQQRKRQEAHDLLVPVCNWFPEGFDTPDLQEAKALLEALA